MKLTIQDVSILSVLLFAGMFAVFNLTVNGNYFPLDCGIASAHTSPALNNPNAASLQYLAQVSFLPHTNS